VEVTVQGDSRLLEDLRAHHIRVIVDLTGSPAANNLRKTVEVSTPAGVTYVSARPQQVEVIFPAPN
jgi:YbbR domain-containing protein